jgi:hypothetical protein
MITKRQKKSFYLTSTFIFIFIFIFPYFDPQTLPVGVQIIVVLVSVFSHCQNRNNWEGNKTKNIVN